MVSLTMFVPSTEPLGQAVENLRAKGIDRLDIVIANAGVYLSREPLAKHTLEEIEKT